MTGSKYISLKHFRIIIAASLLLISSAILLLNINHDSLFLCLNIAFLSILQIVVFAVSEKLLLTKTFFTLFIVSSALLFVFEPHLIFAAIIFTIYKFRQNLLSLAAVIFAILTTGILISIIFSFGINNYPSIEVIILSILFSLIAGYLVSDNYEVVFAAGILYFILFVFNFADIRIGIIAAAFYIYSLFPYKVDNNLGKIIKNN